MKISAYPPASWPLLGTESILGNQTGSTCTMPSLQVSQIILGLANTWSLAQTFTLAPIFTDVSGTRTALGLGTLATQSGTFSGSSSGTNTGDQTTVSGNAGTATALQNARTINGVSFDGTANITVTAAANTLTGTTMASGIVTSSLTTIGTLVGGAVPATLVTGLANSSVGLGNVTNDAQTKAAIVPNTVPSAAQILVGNTGGTAYAPVTVTGDVTITSAGASALATAQPTVHTWALAQTFTTAPIFTDAAGSRTALGLGTLATQSGTFSGTSSGTNTGDQTTVSGNAGTATTLQTARNINGVSFNGSADITVTAAASTLTGTSLASGVTGSSLTSFGSNIALGTPASGTLTNCTFPTFNQNTTGSAASISVSGQTGIITITGITSTNRNKSVRDAADTLLELGGSYTPTGTWTSLTMVTPVLGTPTSGTLTNCTIPASALTGTSLASGITGSSLTSFGASIALGTPASGTLTNCTIPASAITGTTLASGVTASSLTSVGTLASPTFSGTTSEGSISLTGTCSKYNNINTVSNGVPAEYATIDTTSLSAAVTTATLYTPAATGMFRITAILKITTTGTSPVAGPITITYTDGDGSVAQSIVMLLQSTTGTVVTTTVNNSTTTGTVNGSMVIYAKTGVAIQYAIAVSGTFGAGRYSAHLKCEAL